MSVTETAMRSPGTKATEFAELQVVAADAMTHETAVAAPFLKTVKVHARDPPAAVTTRAQSSRTVPAAGIGCWTFACVAFA